MTGAIDLQHRGALRARRVLAAIAGLWLVAFGVLASRHEAGVAHYIDAATGAAFHASAMHGDHTGAQSDVHSSDAAPDRDACGIATAFHQASSPAVASAQLASHVRAESTPAGFARRSIAIANHRVYRIAPKTSPPVAA